MNLTPHFTLDELLVSPTATARQFSEQFTPSEVIVGNLTILATKLLEPLRVSIGVVLNSSSGYRCVRLNNAVGGEPTSQHLKGEAVDLTSPTLSVDELYSKFKTAGIPFDQLIIEHDSSGHRWVHASYNTTGEQRGQCYIGVLQSKGGTIVTPDGYGTFKNKD